MVRRNCLAYSVLGFVTLFTSTSAVAADEWILLAGNNNIVWEGRSHSLVMGKNSSGEPIYMAKGRVTDKKSQAIEFEQWYVRTSDCIRGSGKVVTADMDGNFKYENDFVLKGGNVASSLADMLCYNVTDAKEKGIAS